MAKKSTKKIKSTPEYDSERETRVLLEQIDRSVKTVAEQHGSIVKKLEEHDGRFDKLDKRFDAVEMAVMENGRQIKELKASYKTLQNGQQEIKQKLDTVTPDHENRIRKLEVVR